MILKLNRRGTEQPSWWTNFVDHVFDTTSHSINIKFRINLEANKYGGKFVLDGIEFEKEEDLTFFLLKWS